MTLTAKFLESYSRLQHVTFNGIQSFNSESGHSWPLAPLPPTLPFPPLPPPFSLSPWKWIAKQKNGSRQSLKLFTEPPKERWMKLIHHWARDPESNADWKASQRESRQGREIEKVTSCRKLCDLKKKSTGGIKEYSPLAKTSGSAKKDAIIWERGLISLPLLQIEFLVRLLGKDRNWRTELRNG